MTRAPARRALELTDAIYAAAVDAARWTEFLEALSAELGGAGMAMSLLFPGWNRRPDYYRAGLSERYVPAFERHFQKGLPWPMGDPWFRSGFVRGNGLFPDEQVADTEYYRDWMEPQDLAPEGPLAHVITETGGRPVAGISAWRRVDGRVFDDDDVALCNLLVPHLATAQAIQLERIRDEQERSARTGILDRLRVGVLILDESRRAVVANRSAREILADRDGLLLRDGVLRASHPRDERALQELLTSAIRFDASVASNRRAFETDFLGISRPSGRQPYALTVSRLYVSPDASVVGDEVAAVFVADPASGHVPHADNFRDLFGLSPAEAETVALLAAGHSLEAISEMRNVGVSTTRTLLKRVRAKTRTRRQGEIVRIVLSLDGVLGDDAPDD